MGIRKLEEIEIIEIDKNIENETNEFIDKLHKNDDGFITIATANGKWEEYNFKVENLKENINKIIGLNTNTYITPNSFYKPKRAIENIRKINAIYLEFDNHGKKIPTELDIQSLLYFLYEEVFGKLLPLPEIVIKSGRGVHFYWVLEDLPKQGITLWTVVRDAFAEILEEATNGKEGIKGLALDRNSMDLARVLRLPGTINTKTNTLCNIIHVENQGKLRLNDIIKGYLPDLKVLPKVGEIVDKPKRVNQSKNNNEKQNKVIRFFNYYSLHYARIQDIVKLIELRKGNMHEKREITLFIYRYLNCLFSRDPQKALEDTIELNKQLNPPLPIKEVVNATKSAEMAYEKWLETEHLLKWEEGKKRTKVFENGTYNIKGYNWRTKTLVKIFDITAEEMPYMINLIDKDEKNNRDKKTRKENRRNAAGLTNREQQKEDLINKIKELKLKGMKQKEIAEELNITKGTVSKYLKL